MKKNNEITVKEWVDIWLPQQKFYVKESTYGTYSNQVFNHIIPYFGNRYLRQIREEHNQEFISYLYQYGRKDKKGGLSTKTIKDIVLLWSMILQDAAIENYTDYKIKKFKYPPSKEIARRKYLSQEQEKQVIAMLKYDLNLRNLGILLALYTGMRIGEICALGWDEIDLEAKTIQVVKTLQRIYVKEKNGTFSKIIISAPKSKKSIRTIPISQELANIMEPYQKDSAYFLTGKVEKYIEPRVYREYYNRVMAKNDILFVSFHGLRHTFATRCIEAGCDYKTLSEILGHADVSTTMRLYVHSDLAQKRTCIEKMQSIYKL